MAVRIGFHPQPVEPRRVADREFREQVLPFACQLAAGHGDRFDRAHRPDLAAVEGVASRCRLGVDRRKVGVDRQPRRGVGMEALELRMAGVAARPAAQDGLGQQGFAPQGEQPLAIEILRMQ
jgi:hypothetical protein